MSSFALRRRARACTPPGGHGQSLSCSMEWLHLGVDASSWCRTAVAFAPKGLARYAMDRRLGRKCIVDTQRVSRVGQDSPATRLRCRSASLLAYVRTACSTTSRRFDPLLYAAKGVLRGSRDAAGRGTPLMNGRQDSLLWMLRVGEVRCGAKDERPFALTKGLRPLLRWFSTGAPPLHYRASVP